MAVSRGVYVGAGVTVALVFYLLWVLSARTNCPTCPSSAVPAQVQLIQPVALDSRDDLRVAEWWKAAALLKWDWEKPVEYVCKNIQKFGNWHVCMDEKYAIKPPCLVYSFGINNDWSFDDAAGRLGCEVHSFDPSLKRNDFNRSENVHFHNLGISGSDDDNFVAIKDAYVHDKQIWKMATVKTIMKRLGHENRVLDILKVDVETHEWAATRSLVESGVFFKVRQYLVEWHMFPTYPKREKFVEFWQTYSAMKKMGFQTFRYDFHHRILDEFKWRLQADANYVNTDLK